MIKMRSNGCAISGRASAGIDNERGMALIIVMVMLVLLSILGATMLASSTSDLKIAGNYRNSEESFYTAEAALEFGQTFDTIYTTCFPGGASSWPTSGNGTVLNTNNFSSGATNNTSPHNADYNQIAIPGTNVTADVKVDFVGTGALPKGIGTQEDAGLGPGTSFKANNFVVNAIAYGQNNSQAKLESELARIVPQ
jgi:Tfp pilus assembly protein PilX